MHIKKYHQLHLPFTNALWRNTKRFAEKQLTVSRLNTTTGNGMIVRDEEAVHETDNRKIVVQIQQR
jgi:hypothetical protein